jgi:hypothetical protein
MPSVDSAWILLCNKGTPPVPKICSAQLLTDSSLPVSLRQTSKECRCSGRTILHAGVLSGCNLRRRGVLKDSHKIQARNSQPLIKVARFPNQHTGTPT